MVDNNIFPLLAKKNLNSHFPFQFNRLRMKIGARVSCVMCVSQTGVGNPQMRRLRLLQTAHQNAKIGLLLQVVGS